MTQQSLEKDFKVHSDPNKEESLPEDLNFVKVSAVQETLIIMCLRHSDVLPRVTHHEDNSEKVAQGILQANQSVSQ